MPIFKRPSVLVIYREDHRILLDSVIPRPASQHWEYDFILASQPWRAKISANSKAEKIVAPLARSLAPGGRLYRMHTLPSEIGTAKGIGTSTLFAAWNAAIYVNQIEEERLEEVMTDGSYLKATANILNKYGRLLVSVSQQNQLAIPFNKELIPVIMRAFPEH